ncbi:intermembrane transport protein PqiB [Methylobacter sp. S3L5C]|uniref:PqiB family protein n=1 Tax=Methylobacter sp. S3L5C TaxID=2839024 RepID=UPI001FACB544|nr:MlaD family protein [Methylobacter sp. S3L5C]UOA09377.1 MCE family protein [Methylobacter sp. S3L5C]
MNDFIEPPYEATDTAVNKNRELPLIWLLPICALLVSAWLIYKTVSEKGPEITISFLSADGLEIDKTKIKYLDVEIGKVSDIVINKDLKTISVTAQMDKESRVYLTNNTQFWVVKPQIGLAGVSGLGTLMSGAYIAIKPEEGEKERHFKGLNKPPVLETNAQGKKFILETTNLGSMGPGTQINFHGIAVGQVLEYALAKDADNIKLTVFVNAPYDQFIRTNTRFWIDSGIDLSAGADGFKLRTGPLAALLGGGIAFRASSDDKTADIAPENTPFQLFDDYDQSTQVIYQRTVKVVMYFSESVRGLTVGAPVLLRGIPVGRVTDINLEIDGKTAEILIPVVVEVEPDRIIVMNKQANMTVKDNIVHLIEKGLRAQLQTGSLLTGQLFVALDIFPQSKVEFHQNDTGYQEFPTTPNSMSHIVDSAQAIMDKISKLPLEAMTTEINKTLASLQSTSKAATKTLVTADGTLGSADKTLQSADKAMNSAQKVLTTLEPGSTTQYELNQLLQELTQTASSVRQLTDYLEEHPDSLIRGKKEK